MMNEDQLLSSFLSVSYTRPDILRRLRLVREYFETKFFGPDKDTAASRDLATYLAIHNVPANDIEAFASWSEKFYQTFTTDNLYKLLNTISEMINNLPTIGISVPFEPAPDDVKKLGAWMRQNVNPTVIMEIHINPTILGGCAVAYKGYYRDYSLRYYIEKNHDQIRKILDKYATEFKAS